MDYTYYFIAGLFITAVIIAIRMILTNKEEWLFTTIINSLMIGSIIGIIIGTGTGYLIWKDTGLYLGSAYGIITFALAFAICNFAYQLFNKEKKKTDDKKEDKKEIKKEIDKLDKLIKEQKKNLSKYYK